MFWAIYYKTNLHNYVLPDNSTRLADCNFISNTVKKNSTLFASKHKLFIDLPFTDDSHLKTSGNDR